MFELNQIYAFRGICTINQLGELETQHDIRIPAIITHVDTSYGFREHIWGFCCIRMQSMLSACCKNFTKVCLCYHNWKGSFSLLQCFLFRCYINVGSSINFSFAPVTKKHPLRTVDTTKLLNKNQTPMISRKKKSVLSIAAETVWTYNCFMWHRTCRFVYY